MIEVSDATVDESEGAPTYYVQMYVRTREEPRDVLTRLIEEAGRNNAKVAGQIDELTAASADDVWKKVDALTSEVTRGKPKA